VNVRRKLLVAFGLSVFAAPASLAQQRGKIRRVGFLTAQRRPDSLQSGIFGAFLKSMRELGYLEGSNLMVEWRFADGRYERLPGLAADLVRLGVDVIVTLGTIATAAAQKATTTIPIVIGSVDDPVRSGFVKSLARPGGNITGLSNIAVDVGPKLLEMLHAMVPGLSQVALLLHPDNTAHPPRLKSMESAGHKTGVTILPLRARSPDEIDSAFQTMARSKVHGLVIARDTFFNERSAQIANLAARHRLPSIAGVREYAEAGGLMSYGSSLLEYFRRAAVYVDKIFKGAKPADLPVEQPAKLEFLINRRTASALGLAIPPSLLAIADEIIE
jgi:putative tryptophan/tyrosine transport system substrate-binding protein